MNANQYPQTQTPELSSATLATTEFIIDLCTDNSGTVHTDEIEWLQQAIAQHATPQHPAQQ